MPCIKAIFLHSLRYASSILPSSLNPLSSTTPSVNSPNSIDALLADIPASSLHAALHNHLPEQFKHGMFEHDAAAVRALHSTNAQLATKLVAAARYDLLRREAGNGTVTTTSTGTQTKTTTTTSEHGQTTNVPTTTTTGAGGGTTLPPPSTLAGGGILVTTTDAQGRTVVATVTPSGGGVYSEVVLQTSTLPNGVVQTLTSFSVVQAPKPTSQQGGSGSPNLQSGAERRKLGWIGAFVMGLVAVGCLI